MEIAGAEAEALSDDGIDETVISPPQTSKLDHVAEYIQSNWSQIKKEVTIREPNPIVSVTTIEHMHVPSSLPALHAVTKCTTSDKNLASSLFCTSSSTTTLGMGLS